MAQPINSATLQVAGDIFPIATKSCPRLEHPVTPSPFPRMERSFTSRAGPLVPSGGSRGSIEVVRNWVALRNPAESWILRSPPMKREWQSREWDHSRRFGTFGLATWSEAPKCGSRRTSP
jgi:hypothetical protein